MLNIILISVIIILVFYKFCVVKYPPNHPPGPKLIVPIIATSLEEVYRLIIGQDEIEKHNEYRKRYGNTYSLMLAGERIIFMSDYSTIKDTFNDEKSNFRPIGSNDFRKGWADFKGGDGFSGIADSHGNVWKEQRRFALQNLKDFGFGKASMEAQIQEEIQEFTSDLNTKINENEDINFGVSFNITVMNVLSRIISRTRFDINKDEDKQMFLGLGKIFELIGGFKVFLAFGCPYSLKEYNPYYKTMMKLVNSMYDMIERQKKLHLKTYDENDMRDFMDCYLTEMKRVTETNDTNSSFYGDQGEVHLKASILDLYIAGSETSSTTLLFCIIYMVNFPDIQKKVQDELDKVVGPNRLPSLADKPQLPYLEATLSEVQRCSNVAHQSIVHSNLLEPIQIDGYTVPTESILVSNLAAVMLDPVNFRNPEKFIPERFICDETGNFKPHPLNVPFGVGKRECPGKSLAKIELYLFFSTLMHQYTFLPAKGGAPKLDDVIYPLSRAPKPFKVKVIRRE